jgi:mono/diheme cytochrome c family protein
MPRHLVQFSLISAVALTAFVAQRSTAENRPVTAPGADFQPIYRVLISPRCVNCHSDADAPLQGDDSHLHAMDVKRGRDGLGTPALRCANCHQVSNSNAEHGPPGTPDWRLPPANQRMAWKGRSAAAICNAVKDPAQNGNKDAAALAEHIMSPLVRWGWQPGNGRTVPPISYDAFASRFRSWLAAGSPCPAE